MKASRDAITQDWKILRPAPGRGPGYSEFKMPLSAVPRGFQKKNLPPRGGKGEMDVKTTLLFTR